MMKAGEAGFTLVETLVAMVIFAITSLAMTSLMVTGARASAENDLASQAVILAQEDLEDVRTYRYAQMLTAPSRTATSAKGQVTFTIVRTVATDAPAASMKTVTVTVSWNAQGGSRTYATQSIFTQLVSNL
jgi:prepilin-type N-terminal cleavage/methylation domain-containing protein